MSGNAKIIAGKRRLSALLTRRLARTVRVDFWSCTSSLAQFVMTVTYSQHVVLTWFEELKARVPTGR